MLRKNLQIKGAKILLLGFTFKEDCPDVRNTRVIDIYNELVSYEVEVDVHDPWANPKEVINEYSIELKIDLDSSNFSCYSAIILAVAHKEFLNLNFIKTNTQVIFDVKGVLPKSIVDKRL
jgi:UDP-N-acetyl-D-galactosamine dehydrogenase